MLFLAEGAALALQFSGKDLMHMLGWEGYPTKPKSDLASIVLEKLLC
jgi:hypothetical protein